MEMAVGEGALGTDTAKQWTLCSLSSRSYSSFSASVSAAGWSGVYPSAPPIFRQTERVLRMTIGRCDRWRRLLPLHRVDKHDCDGVHYIGMRNIVSTIRKIDSKSPGGRSAEQVAVELADQPETTASAHGRS